MSGWETKNDESGVEEGIISCTYWRLASGLGAAVYLNELLLVGCLKRRMSRPDGPVDGLIVRPCTLNAQFSAQLNVKRQSLPLRKRYPKN